MNKTKIILLVAVVIIAAFLTIFIAARLRSSGTPANTTQTPVTTFPLASSSPVSGNAPSTIMTIDVQNNQKLSTKDFIHNGVTIPDFANQGNYLLAGDLGDCPVNTPCTAGNESNFNIFFDQGTQTFTIALLAEPLGETRHQAEVYLENALGISAQQLCSLKYYIGTTYRVNEAYASGSLGFSMCPGAVKLPQ